MDKLELPSWFKVIIFVPTYFVFLLLVTVVFYKLSFDILFSSIYTGGSNFINVVDSMIKKPPYRYLLTLRIITEVSVVILFLILCKNIFDPTIAILFKLIKELKLRFFLLGSAIGALAIALPALFLWLTGNLVLQDVAFPLQDMLYFIVIYMGVALVEEVVMRGYILMHLVNSTGVGWGVLISSLFFTVLHASNDAFSLIAFSNIFLSGVLLSLLFLHFRSLWLVIGTHFAWNFFQGMILGFNVSGFENSGVFNWQKVGNLQWTGGNFGLEGSLMTLIVMILIVLTLLGLYYFRKLDLKSIYS